MEKVRDISLDYVRCFAFFIILWFHYGIKLRNLGLYSGKLMPIEFANVNMAEIGVSTFFVLSGICLTRFQSYNSFNSIEFYKKRLKRILPVFYIGYLFVFVFRFMTNNLNTGIPSWTIIFSLLGLDGYVNAIFGIKNYYLIGEWFLGGLLILYLLFPVLYKEMYNHPKCTLCIIICIYFIMICINDIKHPNDKDIIIRLPEFYVGMLIGNKGREDNDILSLKSFLISLVILIIVLFIRISFIPHMLFISSIGVIIFFVVGYIGNILQKYTSFLNHIIIFLSGISFSTYLLHHVISDELIIQFSHFIRVGKNRVVIIFIIVLCLDILAGIILDKIYKYVIDRMNNCERELGKTDHYCS